MPAQSGSAVVLDYGPQGSQQLGGAVVLDFFVPPTTRRIVASTHTSWGAGEVRRKLVVAPHAASLEYVADVRGPWVPGEAEQSEQRAPWVTATISDLAKRAPWDRRSAVAQVEQRSAWVKSLIADDGSGAPWGYYEASAARLQDSFWAISARSDHAAGAPWGGPQVFVEIDRGAVFPGSARRDRERHAPWGRFFRTLSPGVGVFIPPDDGVPEARVVVPVRSVYVQVNATSLRRVSDDTAIPTFNASANLDFASWVWSFNASVPASVLSLVEPVDGEPVELEALVNGTALRFLVEHISRDRTFSKAALSISGRGKAALLDSPYAPAMTFGNTGARTVEQLMNDALTLNEVSLGWDVNFGLTDWLVPAGLWSHAGSYMDAVNRLAEAGGGYVQADMSLQTLHILPKYPFAPWEWSTLVDPDFELPSAPVTRESIEWVNKPKYNRVFVQGMAGGILGRVTRDGTAGDLVAPTIVDALTTHVDAARQRGLPVLAETGRMAYIGLRLPVLDETGVIPPGKFVRYVDGGTTRVGLVRSVNLDIASPQLWQTIKLETHL